jgi:short-chain fatty acids transporter
MILAAISIGVAPLQVARSFGSGFWSLIPFTMQMVFIILGGYAVADSPPIARLIRGIAAIPRDGRSAVAIVACVSQLVSLVHWGLSMVMASL